MAATAKNFGEEDTRPVKLLFQDEGRFGRISDPAHCWAPKGIRPIVPTHIVKSIPMYSALYVLMTVSPVLLFSPMLILMQ